jgi:GntR family transcriptional regulator/MocR family aminotransferase
MWISIDSDDSLPLTRQLYQKIKDMILSKKLTPGEKLPSTRALSGELKISRNTVMEAYNQLIAEGYLEGRHGSGTVVTSCLSNMSKYPNHIPVNNIISQSDHSGKWIDFRSGVPDLTCFPRREWGKLYHDICYELTGAELRYSSPAGVLELRRAISQYLYRTRGISCSPDRIMIVSGSTQGLSLTAKLLYQEKHQVITEDPIHSGLLKVITGQGNQITGIPVDGLGMCTDMLPLSAPVAFIYTTPSHQYPMGAILPLRRRSALIQYAMEHDCYIIEDDYDSEFRYEEQPVNSLYELNPEKVIYTGSFSKILAPAIRLGFLLLPDNLIEQYKSLKQYSDVHTEAISQYALARFIDSGGLERHIWKMKKLYNKKREHLLNELAKHFEGEYSISGQAAGLHVVVHFHKVVFTCELLEQITAAHIKIYPVANYSINHRAEHQNEIIMGYAHLTFEEITEGIRLLRNALDKAL